MSTRRREKGRSWTQATIERGPSDNPEGMQQDAHTIAIDGERDCGEDPLPLAQSVGRGEEKRSGLVDRKTLFLAMGLVLIVLAAYANHFQNTFHFDDFHAVTGNTFISDLRNVPLFFVNAGLMSTSPAAATYRPVTTASLAIDYWLGHGLQPFWFHLSTFFWFEVQLVLMFLLFRRIMDQADRHPSNVWTALAATAFYGLHPANAETVNYIVQRADLYVTLGMVASLLWFVAYPAQRKRGWYLLPAVLACLSKAPALIFPLILLAYIFLFEEGDGRRWPAAIRAALPALAVGAAAAILTAKMTPATFSPGANSPWLYRLTQPWVALHYFKSFFLPTELSADTDWTYVSGFSGKALAGYLFVAALLGTAVYAARRRSGGGAGTSISDTHGSDQSRDGNSPLGGNPPLASDEAVSLLNTRPIAFGILWFFLALLPTSLLPLAEVTNDHRMFFPFVGLALAVFWALRLLLFGWTARLTTNRSWVRVAVAGMAVVLVAAAAGTRERNAVWRTEESLWHDVTIKSPKNSRGWMNYGVQFAAKGEYGRALPYLEHALAVKPDSASVELNLGSAMAGLGRQAEAGEHFHRSLALGDWPEQHYVYGIWLHSQGRSAEAQAQFETAIERNRFSFPARNMLMQIYSEKGDFEALDRLFQDTLRIAYNEEAVRRFRTARDEYEKSVKTRKAAQGPSPAALTRHAAELCQDRKYEECLEEAQKVIEIRPDYAEAYNNKAYALIAMNRLDEAIRDFKEAVRLKPDYTTAKNNLARALEQKRREEQPGRPAEPR